MLKQGVNMETTFVMIKPDGVKQKLFKNIMEMLLDNNLSITDVNIVNYIL